MNNKPGLWLDWDKVAEIQKSLTQSWVTIENGLLISRLSSDWLSLHQYATTLAQAQARERWIPVSERLPTERDIFLTGLMLVQYANGKIEPAEFEAYGNKEVAAGKFYHLDGNGYAWENPMPVYWKIVTPLKESREMEKLQREKEKQRDDEVIRSILGTE